MTSRGTLNVVERKIRGTVKGGVIVVDAPIEEGAEVTVLVDSKDMDVPIEFDANGDIIMTPELEAELQEAEAEADRGEGIPWEVVREEMRRKYP